MKNIFFCLFLSVANICFAWNSLSPGTYKISGATADGSPYTGEVIIRKQGDNYHLEWMTGSQSTQKGIGIFDSDSGVLSVAFADTKNSLAWGVASYKVDFWGNNLEGNWTMQDGRMQGYDHLEWKSWYTY